MTTPSILSELAAACGIVPEYHDIWGGLRRADDDCLRAILGAMGVDTSSDASLAAALAERHQRPWRETLAPVLVARLPFEELRVRLNVPRSRSGETFGWALEHEDGKRVEGSLVPGELPVVDQREIDGVGDVIRCELTVPGTPPAGYHRFVLSMPGSETPAACRVIVAPERCYTPPSLREGGRVWGPGAQIYALRSPEDWGIGDYTCLARLAEIFGREGAGILGVSPLHALPSHNPLHRSPYSPWSREFLNHLYLDVAAVAEFPECADARKRAGDAAFQERLGVLREREFIRYDEVAEAKRPVLELLYRHFRRQHLARGTSRAQAFREFQRERGDALRAYGTFEALQEHFHDRDHSVAGWNDWPVKYRWPASSKVADFAEDHLQRVEFFEYLQWLCEQQLGEVERSCAEQRMGVGLYQDLAVGVDGNGFEAWWNQDVLARGATSGAPPDDFNLKGQGWGLIPYRPDRLRETGYESYARCLRANMRHAGALRIDHVMGLMRLFWVPAGREAVDGAYVRYPFQDLLGVVALESQRNRCMVVGEDLGTVPDEVRQGMDANDVLGCRLLYFTREWDGRFTPPSGYPEKAVAAVATHDLPTLRGFWEGRDLALRDELDLFPNEEVRENQIAARREARPRLLEALRKQGLLPDGVAVDGDKPPEMTPELVAAIHAFVARSPAKAFILQLEDLMGQLDQVNLPGTIEEYPNWKLRLAGAVEDLAEVPALDRTAAPRPA